MTFTENSSTVVGGVAECASPRFAVADQEDPMTHGVVLREDLPLLTPVGRGPIPGERLLEGRAFGLAHLTLVLGETPPGQGTRLHRHSVEEVIVVHAGRGTFTLGETIVEVGPGEAVIIPPGVPHRFFNHTQETLYHTDVFASDHFAVEVLAD